MQEVCLLLAFAFDKAGNNMAARIAMMAMTTSSSIKVKPAFRSFVRNGGTRLLLSMLVFHNALWCYSLQVVFPESNLKRRDRRQCHGIDERPRSGVNDSGSAVSSALANR